MTNTTPILRQIRSFVRREGRLTPGQQKALELLWPSYGLDDGTEQLDFDTLFQRTAPTILEIGFGNGHSLLQMAKNAPENNFIGVEVHRPGVGQLLMAIEQEKVTNIRVACMDAVELLKRRIPDASLEKVQIFFPDPWHKKRHHKRRIIQPEFVATLASKIRQSGKLHLATDWQHYAQHMLKDVSDNQNFKNTSPTGDFIERPDYRPLTKFEQRGQRLGHGVWDILFTRI